MPATLEDSTVTVALIGNPNTGKSTLLPRWWESTSTWVTIQV